MNWKKISSHFIICSLPLFFCCADFAIRSEYLLSQNGKELLLFLVSIAYESLFYFTIFFFLSRIPKFKNFVIGFYSTFLSFVFIVVYGHFFYFGVLPNNVSINFVIDHYQDAYALTSASIHWHHLLIFLFLSAGIFFVSQKSVEIISSFSKKITYTVLVIFLGMTLSLSNNVRFHPDSYSFTPNTLFALKYVAQERLFGSQFEIRRGYVKRQFTIKERETIQPKFNCLIILGESARGMNMRYNGYERPTAPFVERMIAEKKIIPFKNYFANCVSTQYAVPMILSGNFTIEKLHQPYLYDYVKSWTTAKTFFISSQSMVVSNIHLVYETLLDTFICQERTALKQFNDMGVSDQEILPIAVKFLQNRNNEKFFGIIQFNNTHYPYGISDKKYERFVPAEKLSLNSYDNALLEQDDIIQKYFSFLSEQKLLDSTVVLYLSDHGEAFGEHGHSGHLQTLYQEDICAPMWMYIPASFPQKYKDAIIANNSKNVSHLDIFPTVLELFGINNAQYLNLTPAGKSLFSTIEASRTIPLVGMDMIDTRGIVVDSMKYIVTFRQNKRKEELYNLKLDLKEEKNLWNELSEMERKYFLKKYSEAEQLRLSYSAGLQIQK